MKNVQSLKFNLSDIRLCNAPKHKEPAMNGYKPYTTTIPGSHISIHTRNTITKVSDTIGKLSQTITIASLNHLLAKQSVGTHRDTSGSSIRIIYRTHDCGVWRQGKRNRVCLFHTLVSATTGGMGRETATFYKRLADMLSTKKKAPYSSTMASMRCTLSFTLLRSAVMCIHGSRSSSHRVSDASIELGVAESCLAL